ncbi:hypothetical protein B0T20DRAFT_492207 [Sordaria brevicollis]|uniref:DUF6594 domain-containing protein n=1 Tax=Sordaria brevicollis TaxID=83679 RepID=A0AAE0UEP7_SORBR|nr:hypothetical protein B0T20DRAFT_492207 [Sordaria brevicollis]
MPSEPDQQSVRSSVIFNGLAEVLEANNKAWSIDLERGETQTQDEEPRGRKGNDGDTKSILEEKPPVAEDEYPSFDEIDPDEDPASYVNMQVADAPPGYPMLARFISSHEDGYIFREFRYLQSRTLLHMQDELRELERKLHLMDQYDLKHRPLFLKSREVDDTRLRVRRELMEEIGEKLKKYGDLLTVSNNLANFDRPSRFDLQSLENFFKAKEPLVRHERYLNCQGDMITLKAGRDDAWLDEVIMRLLVKYNCAPLRYIFTNAETRAQTGPKNSPLNIFSIARVHFLKMVILITLMLCLLCLPLVPLYSWTQGGSGGASGGETDSDSDSDSDGPAVTGETLAKVMGLIVACAFAFGVVLSVCTRAKKHEIFGSCAAYVFWTLLLILLVSFFLSFFSRDMVC